MVIQVSMTQEYIPEWNGNKNDANPIKIKHRAATRELVDELIPKPVLKIKTNSEGADGGEMEVTIDPAKFVRRMVTGVSNLTVEIVGADGSTNKRVITSADDLLAPDLPAEVVGLADEIGTYLQRILSKKKVDEKN